MTDEELAEQYAIENYEHYEEGQTDYKALKQAFLAGLEAGKPKRHKVADGDYPPCEKGNYTITVLTDKGDIAYYSYNYDCWIAEPSGSEIDPPIAWCEISKFTEE